MSTASRKAELPPKAPPPLVWRSWPLRDEWHWTAGWLFVAAVLGLTVLQVTGNPRSALLTLLVLLIALWRLWLPVRYEISPKGIVQKIWRRRRIAWHSVGQCKIRRGGVLLLGEEDDAPLEFFRGHFLPWGRHRKEVLGQLEFYLNPANHPVSTANTSRRSTRAEDRGGTSDHR